MYFLYGILLTVGFIVLLPRFIFDAIFKGKYAAGFKQRLGFVPKFYSPGQRVVWLHCVSVGEVNAARPLAERIKKDFPNCRLIVSTTTRAGQKLARDVFCGCADLVFYFPFDWQSTVRRSLRRLNPSVILLMETEIWFNFIRQAKKKNIGIAIVNGRISERSFKRYGYIRRFVRRVLGHLDLAIMQDKADATRLMSLGLRASKVKVTGNIKFDHEPSESEPTLTSEFMQRFGITPAEPLILAASTHKPEERWLLDAFKEIWKTSGDSLPRLMIAPRHPERFEEVAALIGTTGFSWARRSAPEAITDKDAEIILLDSIGELRSAYPLASLVFVGGSLIPHGGQSVFEPAAAGRAIIIGPHTANFAAAVTEFLGKDALVQLARVPDKAIVPKLVEVFNYLLPDDERRANLGANALNVMDNNRGAVERTMEYLTPLLGRRDIR
jgi:3-deoxy-D-manno-octulosonic-acid transferase